MAIDGTIVARASAPGGSRRAVVRVSGARTGAVLAALGVEDPGRRGAFCGRASVLSGGDLPVLLVRFVGPASYTGEDAAEVVVPGNAHLVEMLLERACGVEGVRRAGPGEFSARAYLAGKLTLAQAEGVAAKIAAEGAAGLAAADRVLSGRAGQEHRAWAEELAGLLALVEAGIDFSDQEDVVAIGSGRLGGELAALRAEIAGAIGSGFGELGSERPLVVLVGLPNAGKSTLFNALLGRERVVASEVAGTTRDVIVERLGLSEYGGVAVDLADLPGLEEDGADAVSAAAQAGARRALARADLALVCVRAGDEAVAGPAGVERVRVETRADGHVGGADADLAVCAVDGWHIERLRRLIAERVRGSRRGEESGLIPRHRERARAAVGFLDAAIAALAGQEADELMDAEVVAGSLRGALDELGEITGRISPDAIIGRIFASFCIGK